MNWALKCFSTHNLQSHRMPFLAARSTYFLKDLAKYFPASYWHCIPTVLKQCKKVVVLIMLEGYWNSAVIFFRNFIVAIWFTFDAKLILFECHLSQAGITHSCNFSKQLAYQTTCVQLVILKYYMHYLLL